MVYSTYFAIFAAKVRELKARGDLVLSCAKYSIEEKRRVEFRLPLLASVCSTVYQLGLYCVLQPLEEPSCIKLVSTGRTYGIPVEVKRQHNYWCGAVRTTVRFRQTVSLN